MSIQKIYVNGQYSDTFWRVDPTTLQVYADTDESRASLFEVPKFTGSTPGSILWSGTGANGKALQVDPQSGAITVDGEPGSTDSLVVPFYAEGVPPGDLALEATATEKLLQATPSSGLLAADLAAAAPVPQSAVWESIVVES